MSTRSPASRILPPAIGVMTVAHGAIHLLGVTGLPAASGTTGSAGAPGALGTTDPSAATSALWAVAAVLVLAAGVGLLLRRRRWWLVGTVAVVVSQAAVLTAWPAAAAGTVANAVLALAVVHGWCAEGPWSLRERYRRGVAAALATVAEAGPTAGAAGLTEDDLAHLPAQVATFLRRTGAVGRPAATAVRASLTGRIRGGATAPWMRFTGEQVNTYGARLTRHFRLDAVMLGLPVDVVHAMVDGVATMEARLCSVIPVARGAGPEMDRAETVTLLNDVCLLAPEVLAAEQIRWEPVDEHRVRAVWTNAGQAVAADLVVDDDGDLVDFVSDDRLRASGRGFVPQRWSTPLGRYRTLHGRRTATSGSALWHAPEPEGTFAYLEMDLDDVEVLAPAAGVPALSARG